MFPALSDFRLGPGNLTKDRRVTEILSGRVLGHVQGRIQGPTGSGTVSILCSQNSQSHKCVSKRLGLIDQMCDPQSLFKVALLNEQLRELLKRRICTWAFCSFY